ncbi:hypothetical protein ATZ33_09895 [Enterococcus silesiacus]|uniref:Uncharacterized protein n=1 Tax=Enterococcus silesiacus TaxID=332949 RepID=A0A0S3KBM0_9ENTE|nr:PRD domain-containing protein [Enterococcus silesiacus]ALS01671.1 hypothetical protein ATZ33_09895 [Enterococcus silesiacus]OJG91428.1 hypothetical protein RV15_GL000705 [Enterococcus silesiacus]
MKQNKRLLKMFQQSKLVTLAEIKTKERVSERRAREQIKELKEIGGSHGFEIKTIYGRGYRLLVTEQAYFQQFLLDQSNELDERINHQQFRVGIILFLLFQQHGYITIKELAKYINVSESTVKRDLQLVHKKLQEAELQLESKSHYGVKINGTEIAYRKAFIHHLNEINKYYPTQDDFFCFRSSMDLYGLKPMVSEMFRQKKISISDAGFSSLIIHLEILIYRLENRNWISDFQMENPIHNSYLELADALANRLEEYYKIQIPALERKYLAAQLIGKTSIANGTIENTIKIRQQISAILKLLDQQFLTSFSDDKELIEALLLHIYPMMKRIAFSLTLTNPLIDLVSTKYANTFLIALKFTQLWETHTLDNIVLQLSRDEIGYLALHFAASLEKAQEAFFQQFKRVVLLSNHGRAADYLLNSKITKLFPKASILHYPYFDATNPVFEEADIILNATQTEPELEKNYSMLSIPVIPSEAELNYMKKALLLKKEMNSVEKHQMTELFSEQFFYLKKSSTDSYLQVIEKMAEEMVQKKYAYERFPALVLQREQRFTTIYENGVAGPHSMLMEAKRNCIGACILEKPLIYQGKEVQLIFLLNLKKGNNFLYKEISNLLLAIMENYHLRKQLLQVTSFEEFYQILFSLCNQEGFE